MNFFLFFKNGRIQFVWLSINIRLNLYFNISKFHALDYILTVFFYKRLQIWTNSRYGGYICMIFSTNFWYIYMQSSKFHAPGYFFELKTLIWKIGGTYAIVVRSHWCSASLYQSLVERLVSSLTGEHGSCNSTRRSNPSSETCLLLLLTYFGPYLAILCTWKV